MIILITRTSCSPNVWGHRGERLGVSSCDGICNTTPFSLMKTLKCKCVRVQLYCLRGNFEFTHLLSKATEKKMLVPYLLLGVNHSHITPFWLGERGGVPPVLLWTKGLLEDVESKSILWKLLSTYSTFPHLTHSFQFFLFFLASKWCSIAWLGLRVHSHTHHSARACMVTIMINLTSKSWPWEVALQLL